MGLISDSSFCFYCCDVVPLDGWVCRLNCVLFGWGCRSKADLLDAL